MSARYSFVKRSLAAVTLAAALVISAQAAHAAPAPGPGATPTPPVTGGLLGNSSFERPAVSPGVSQGFWANQQIGTCNTPIANNYVAPGCWTVAAGMAMVGNGTFGAYDGYQALMLQTYNTTYATVWQSTTLQPNRTYTLTMRMKEYAYAPGRVNVRMVTDMINASGQTLRSQETIAASAGTSYHTYTMSFTTPPNTTNGRVKLRFQPADTNATAGTAPIIDRVVLT